jgi:acetoin utilization protein AcuB
MLMPPVSRFMTPNPRAVAPCDRVSFARALMKEQNIHHLPVLDNHKLVGIVTDGDLQAAHQPDDAVSDAMNSHVAAVPDDMPIDEVITLMETDRLGSVVVIGKVGVEGIFTVTDAIRAFRDVLHRTAEGER